MNVGMKRADASVKRTGGDRGDDAALSGLEYLTSFAVNQLILLTSRAPCTEAATTADETH